MKQNAKSTVWLAAAEAGSESTYRATDQPTRNAMYWFSDLPTDLATYESIDDLIETNAPALTNTNPRATQRGDK